jgi:hypothetical protein
MKSVISPKLTIEKTRLYELRSPIEVITLPIAKSQTRSEQSKDMHKKQQCVKRAGIAPPGFDGRWSPWTPEKSR